MAAGDAPAERPALADEVLLADELVERPRPHARRERLPLGRRLEQGLRLRASGPWVVLTAWPSLRGASAREHDDVGASRDRPGSDAAADPSRRQASERTEKFVTCEMTHKPMRTRMSEPPTSTIRRTSRAT